MTDTSQLQHIQKNQTGIRGQTEHRILFDTGPHSAIFLDNARRLEIPFEKIETIVLSHWHVDHSGGMLAAVEKCVQARKEVKGGVDKNSGKRGSFQAQDLDTKKKNEQKKINAFFLFYFFS